MKNFRNAYLNTLGFTGTPVRQEDPLGTLLADPLLDVIKLKATWIRYDMPSRYRSTVWKILLGVLPSFRESWEFVDEQNNEVYEELKRMSMLLTRNRRFVKLCV